MEERYEDLQSLIFHSASARQYFAALPDYAQDMVQDRSGIIRTEKELHSYVDGLLRKNR